MKIVIAVHRITLGLIGILSFCRATQDVPNAPSGSQLPSSLRRRLATAPVDILFIIDESDSMSEEQNDVRERVKEIFSQLPPGSAVGLVGYGRRGNIFPFRPGNPEVLTPLTTEADIFQTAADDLEATGSTEPAYLALYRSVADAFPEPLGFRGDKFCSILITDERSNGSGVSQSQTISALQGRTNSGLESVFFGITVDGVVRRSFERIASETGGAMFRLEDFRRDPSFVLTPVLEACTVAVLDNILLDPATDTKIVGESHSVAASVLRIVDETVIDVGVISDGVIEPQKDVPVSFEVARGPNAGATGVCTEDAGCTTDDAGQLNFTYVGNGGVGVDEIEACFADSVSGTKKCATVSVEWMNNPTLAPSSGPTTVPSVTPTTSPSLSPSSLPSESPSAMPSARPSSLPSSPPSKMPTASPSVVPTGSPSVEPTAGPSFVPTTSPSGVPTAIPSLMPTARPSAEPTVNPSIEPTVSPSVVPTKNPSAVPTAGPSVDPTSGPSVEPSANPSAVPTAKPSVVPSLVPTANPSLVPTVNPSIEPTVSPSLVPTANPSAAPSTGPSVDPTSFPSVEPSANPSVVPTSEPSVVPTVNPSVVPTAKPSVVPTAKPSVVPTAKPSVVPTAKPSVVPTANPSVVPTMAPSLVPTLSPSSLPTLAPSSMPTVIPSAIPTASPSASPSDTPSLIPSSIPSLVPSQGPSSFPSLRPSVGPSLSPSTTPSASPSSIPTNAPSLIPTTTSPSLTPSVKPSWDPSTIPTAMPSRNPTFVPTASPSAHPSFEPSTSPSSMPSSSPSDKPSATPTSLPPTIAPSLRPSTRPTTLFPTLRPSAKPTSPPTETICPLETTEDFVLDEVEFPGETRNCKWLQKPVGNRLALYCNNEQSTAAEDCPLTCRRCNPEENAACEEEERTATFLRDRDGTTIVNPNETNPNRINVRRCKWLVKGQNRVEEFCPRSTSTAAAVCPCHCSQL